MTVQPQDQASRTGFQQRTAPNPVAHAVARRYDEQHSRAPIKTLTRLMPDGGRPRAALPLARPGRGLGIGGGLVTKACEYSDGRSRAADQEAPGGAGMQRPHPPR